MTERGAVTISRMTDDEMRLAFEAKHTQRHMDEITFRWSFRKVPDAERNVAAIRETEGNRLVYTDSGEA